MFDVRTLDDSWMDVFLDLIKKSNTLMGSNIDLINEDVYSGYIGTKNKIYGAFKDNVLYSTLGIKIWNGMPSWSLTNIKTNRDVCGLYFNIEKNGLSDCMNNAITYAENLNIFTYYNIQNHRKQNISKNIWINCPMISNRYEYYTDTIIKKNTMPSYDYQRNLMGNRTWPVDIIIRKGELKDSFRRL